MSFRFTLVLGIGLFTAAAALAQPDLSNLQGMGLLIVDDGLPYADTRLSIDRLVADAGAAFGGLTEEFHWGRECAGLIDTDEPDDERVWLLERGYGYLWGGYSNVNVPGEGILFTPELGNDGETGTIVFQTPNPGSYVYTDCGMAGGAYPPYAPMTDANAHFQIVYDTNGATTGTVGVAILIRDANGDWYRSSTVSLPAAEASPPTTPMPEIQVAVSTLTWTAIDSTVSDEMSTLRPGGELPILPDVDKPQVAGPPVALCHRPFNPWEVQGVAFIITGGAQNDPSQQFGPLNITLYGKEYPPPSLGTSWTVTSGIVTLDDPAGEETVQVDDQGYVCGGHYEGTTGSLTMSTSGLHFDTSNPGSYVYTRFTTLGGATSTIDMSSHTAKTTIGFARYDAYGEPQAGALVAALLVRDDQGWFWQPIPGIPGTPDYGAYKMYYDFGLEWTPLDPAVTADLDQVDNGGDSSQALLEAILGTGPHQGRRLGWVEPGPVTLRLPPAIAAIASGQVWTNPHGVVIPNTHGLNQITIHVIDAADSGTYTCTYSDGLKAIAQYTFTIEVVNGLPVASSLALTLAGLALGISGALRRRR